MNSATNAAIVSLSNVSKNYGKLNVLNNVSLEIEAGEVLGLFGHNGAGKSTLMKIILGVIKASKGNVLTLGVSPQSAQAHHIRQSFGYLPENVSFYEQLSGREILRYFAKLKGFSKQDADKLLEEVGLMHASDRQVKTYSKGMRQRLGLAQALLGQPKLLVLDEPTVGLDPIATNDFYHTVDRLKSEGCSVILCSHILPGVESHIDRAMILGGGKQLALGNIESLRQASGLPIEIKTHGIAANEMHTSLHQFHNTVTNHAGHQSLLVPIEEKMSVVRQLTSDQRINDIEIRQPSLQEIYSHFTKSVNSQGTRIHG